MDLRAAGDASPAVIVDGTVPLGEAAATAVVDPQRTESLLTTQHSIFELDRAGMSGVELEIEGFSLKKCESIKMQILLFLQ